MLLCHLFLLFCPASRFVLLGPCFCSNFTAFLPYCRSVIFHYMHRFVTSILMHPFRVITSPPSCYYPFAVYESIALACQDVAFLRVVLSLSLVWVDAYCIDNKID